LYSSPDIRVIKSRMMQWAGHVACMGGLDMHKNLWIESLKGRAQLKDCINGRIMLKCILGK
jgi:hypothetical protein